LKNLISFFCAHALNGIDDVLESKLVVEIDDLVLVDKGEGKHHDLAVEPVRKSSMAGEVVSEVLDFECALHATCKESAERGNNAGHKNVAERVRLEPSHVDGCESEVEGLGLREKRVYSALSPDRAEWGETQTFDRTRHVGHLLQIGGYQLADQDGNHASAELTLPSLLGRKVDQFPVHYFAPKQHARNVGPNVIDDDQHDRLQEPYDALEDQQTGEHGGDGEHQKNHHDPRKVRELVTHHAFL